MAGSIPARSKRRKRCATRKLKKLNYEVRKMNELLNIAHKLNNEYGNCGHWEIVKAEKTENGWNLTIQPIEEKDEEADNESDK